MSVEPRVLKTEAEQALAEQYRTSRAALPGSGRVRAQRDAAFARFETLGLPHRRVEAWKYTDLRALMRKAAPLAGPPSPDAARQALDAARLLPGLDRHRLVIADGHFQDALSDREAMLSEGVEVLPLAEFLGGDGPGAAEILDPPDHAAPDAMAALNAALASDGVVVRVAAGARVARPVEIVHLTTAGTPVAWFGRNAVSLGAGARLRLVISQAGPDGLDHQTNTFTGLTLDEGASATLVDLHAAGGAAQHIATFTARLEKDAALDYLAVAAGSGLSRLQGFVLIAGEGARLGASSAVVLGDSDHGDVALVVDHKMAEGRTRVLAKNVVDGTARGAFQGRVVVQPGAQKTDAAMLVRTLLLSDDAEFATKPELEIYADDVLCGHGATSGQIDEDMLFYFLSRGIPRAEAETLLLTAFLAEAVEAIGDAELAAAVEPILTGWLSRRSVALVTVV